MEDWARETHNGRLPPPSRPVPNPLASPVRSWPEPGRLARTPRQAAHPQPEQPLRLYEYEASPYCRLVAKR